MSAIITDSDQHYQRHPMASLAQNSANDTTEVLLESGETATNSGTATVAADMKPEFAPNAFGKGKHGATVWDIKKIQAEVSVSIRTEAGQLDNTQEWWITNDGTIRTAAPRISGVGTEEKRKLNASTVTGAAGEIVTIQDLVKDIDYPMEIIDGISFHKLWTRNQYRFGINGTGLPATFSVHLAFDGRRVVVPLTELFFDRDTIAGLLDAVVLEAILG